jgi:hypothetical protein
MITDDEVLGVLERADPARAGDAVPVPDPQRYLDSLRERDTTVTLFDTEPTPTESERGRHWRIISVAASAAALVVTLAVVVAHNDSTAPADAPGPTATVESTIALPTASTATPITTEAIAATTTAGPTPTVTTGAPIAAPETRFASVLENPAAAEIELAGDENVYRPGYGPTEVSGARTYVSLRTCNWVAEPCTGPRGWAYVVGSAESAMVNTGVLGSADELVLSAIDDRLFVASETAVPNSQPAPRAWLIDSVTGQRGALTWQDEPTTLKSADQSLVMFPLNTQPYFRAPSTSFLPRVVDARDGTISPLNVPAHASAVLQIHQPGSGRIWIGTARDGGDAGLAYTDDGGATWTDVELPETLRQASEELLGRPYFEGLTLAATGDRIAVSVALCASGCSDNRLFTSADAGATWVGVDPPPNSGNYRELFVLQDRLVYALNFDPYLAILLESGPSSDWSELQMAEGYSSLQTQPRADFGVGQRGIASLYGFTQDPPMSFSTDLIDWWPIESLAAKPGE